MAPTRKNAKKQLLKRILKNKKSDKPLANFKQAMTVFNNCRASRCATEHAKLKTIDAQIDHACPTMNLPAMIKDPKKAERILGDLQGRVTGMECLRYELGAPDDSGRRRPVEIKGSEFLMTVDAVIVAIGNESNPLIKQTTPELVTNKWGNFTVNEEGKTSIDRDYAGGDIVLGAATVILAMGEGRRAAAAINKLLA